MSKKKKTKSKKRVKKIKKPKKAKKVKKLKTKAKAKVKKKGPFTVYLGLGSNVGDREEYIEQACFILGKTPGIKLKKRSSNYETEAQGTGDQPPFLNAAVAIETKLSPHKLLDKTQETENTLGRERDVEWGPRTIDIDILLYGDQIVSDDRLQVPHPLLHERLFVLLPLKEIAPNVVHPTLEKTVSELYDEKKEEAGPKYDDELPGFKEIKGGVTDDYERW